MTERNGREKRRASATERNGQEKRQASARVRGSDALREFGDQARLAEDRQHDDAGLTVAASNPVEDDAVANKQLNGE